MKSRRENCSKGVRNEVVYVYILYYVVGSNQHRKGGKGALDVVGRL